MRLARLGRSLSEPQLRDLLEVDCAVEHAHGPEEIPRAESELAVLCLVRDGRPYIEAFLKHYFALGAKHVVFLDNGSEDGTVEEASRYDNVTVLRTTLPFKEYQMLMKRYLLERFGNVGRWSLCVDVDELFDYPYSEVVKLPAFLRYLRRGSHTAVAAQMLDMFPAQPISSDASPRSLLLKQDHEYYDLSEVERRPYLGNPYGAENVVSNPDIFVLRGGIRESLFGVRAYLTKHPLIFLDDAVRLVGPHWTAGARIADVSAVLYHYKFLGTFYRQAARAVREENHSRDSENYKKYHEVLRLSPALRIKRETALRLGSVDELVAGSFLVVSPDYQDLVEAEEDRLLAHDSPQEAVRRLAHALSAKRMESRQGAKIAGQLNRRLLLQDERAKGLANRESRLQQALKQARQVRRKLQRARGRERALKQRVENLQRRIEEAQAPEREEP